jgi:putative hydrolase of the HAD superfamily
VAERPPIDAVVFDAGGTLVRLDFEWMASRVTAAGVPLEPGRLRRAEIEGRRAYDRSHGPTGDDGGHAPSVARGDALVYFRGMLEAAGVGPTVVDRVLEEYRARQLERGLWTRPMDGARGAIDALGAMGLRIACVSNSDGRAERHLEACGMRAGLEFVVDSQLVGIEKPDPAIFHIALERLGVAPARALYVGDIRSVDEVGAGRAGMRFVLLDPFGDYGEGAAAAIEDIGRLPAWLAANFAVVAARRSASR